VNILKNSISLPLVPQLAFHSVFKMCAIHQHRSFKPIASPIKVQSSVRPTMLALTHPLLKQLRDKVVQSRPYSSFAGEVSKVSEVHSL